MRLDDVRIPYPDAHETGDGAIHFECPICRVEGHPGKDFTLFASGATSCVRAAAGGRDFNREHCRPVRDRLGLGGEPEPGWLTESLFGGLLTLQCAVSKKERVLTVAINCDETLARNEINLNRADHRAAFVSSIPGFDSELQRAQIAQALLRLADRRESVQAATQDEAESETTEYVIFKELSDGRLAEQLYGRVFAIYDGSSVDVAPKVECDGIIYKPVTGDPCIEDNDLHLPARLIEYGEERLLDEEIEDYLSKFCDAPARELKFAAKLVRLTYIQDRLNEVPYLHIVGPSGSGKTRMSDVVGMVCYHPYLIVEGSAASTFRISDKYGVTMCFDEFNPVVDSEDQAALIQILNAGFQRRRKVPRVEKGPNGEFVTRSFRPFGIKIFSGLKLTGSYAFQRRTIPIQLSVTKNPKIPYCDDGTIDVLSEPLREKLTLWRLRNLARDYLSLIRTTEAVFKSREILPGFIQIGVPLAMLIEGDDLRNDFISTMESRTRDAAEEKKESFDGQVVALIHSRLFDVDDDGNARWKIKGDLPELAEGEPCEGLRVEFLVTCLNEGLPEKKKILDKTFSRYRLRPLGFKTRQLTKGGYKGTSAVIFSQHSFADIFKNFSLPVPGDFVSTVSTQTVNEDGKELAESRQAETESAEISCLDSASSANTTVIGTVETVETESPETERDSFSEASFDQTEAVPTVVALDVETEPFTKNYKDSKTWAKFKAAGKTPVTPQNARMIGLALSFDGAEKTSYTTDPESWPLLAPESDQTVIFHNAKFDLGVLKRAGLAAPEKWEDTMIASHLICETGEHGLKDLAKEHLGVDDPLTFEEADRMRLLDPPVFEEYAKNDARYTYSLWRKFEPEIERQELRRVYELEKSLTPVVMAMEERGMSIDIDALNRAGAELDARIKELEAEIHDLAGNRFNINSTKALATVLTDGLGLELPKTTATGQPSVDMESLEELAGQHPIIPSLVEYREIDKLAGAFVEGVPRFADENNRIHPTFKQLGPTSGRFSCSSPNVQQLPEVRTLLLLPETPALRRVSGG